MADEAVLVLRMDDPIDFIVSNDVGIEKGTVMKMTNPRTAIANSASGDVFAGISKREKIAEDGRTRLALFRRGVFRMRAAESAITAGQWVSTSSNNTIKTATGAEVDEGKGIGIALQDIAISTNGEVFVGGY